MHETKPGNTHVFSDPTPERTKISFSKDETSLPDDGIRVKEVTDEYMCVVVNNINYLIQLPRKADAKKTGEEASKAPKASPKRK